ncbi:MAG TPA: DsbA family protein [Roseiarcus sp.]|nr:DsbA family protein [Roseiarcus sp.]
MIANRGLWRLAAASFVALALSAAASFALAGAAPPTPVGTTDMSKALEPGPLKEISVGEAAGVPVIEYGSLTCPHCAHFDKEVWPAFKAAYIDTGKVRYIFREYSRNKLDVVAFMLARCNGDDKAFATIELLFANQEQWAFVEKPIDALAATLRPTGMTREGVVACLNNQSMANSLVQIVQNAEEKYDIRGTPTFIIDGKIYGGALSIEELDAIVKPLAK